MMKKSRYVLVGLVTLIVFISVWYVFDRFSFSSELPYYSVKAANDTSLTIGIIGDSWVECAKLDTIIQNRLQKHGLKSKIISSGHPGAKSKLIYQNLFKEHNKEYSSRFVIENCPDYCIVIAGVNDAACQIGSHFYAYHMIQIIKTLLHYKIRPVILSLPEFGVENANKNMNIFCRWRNIISAYFNNNGQIDNIKSYRKALINELENENLKDSIILIDFNDVCQDYDRGSQLYNGSSHLSRKGNEKLCLIISTELIKIIITPK
jgi:hypothetical protein